MIEINETNVTIMTNDMDKSIKFYQLIGMKLRKRWDNYYAMLETSGLTIGLHPNDGDEVGSGSVSIGLIVDDLSTIREILKSNLIVYDEISGKSGDYIHFKDPDGTILYFNKPGWSYDD